MRRQIWLLVCLLGLLAGIAHAQAQLAAAPTATSIETVGVTWGAAGLVLLGALTVATTLIGTAAWIIRSVGAIDVNQRVFAATTAAQIAEHERRLGILERE